METALAFLLSWTQWGRDRVCRCRTGRRVVIALVGVVWDRDSEKDHGGSVDAVLTCAGQIEILEEPSEGE